MSEQPTAEVSRQGRSIALWVGVLGTPVLWLTQFEAGYALAPWACKNKAQVVLHLISALCIVLALFAVWLSWRDWKDAGGGSPDETDGGPVARTRFLGALGILLGTLSAMVILAQGIAGFFFDGCWT